MGQPELHWAAQTSTRYLLGCYVGCDMHGGSGPKVRAGVWLGGCSSPGVGNLWSRRGIKREPTVGEVVADTGDG